MNNHFDIWLAGFWEGEGCFSIHKSKYINFSLTQSGKRGKKILQTVQKYFKERGIISYLHIQKINKNPKAKTCYQLRIRNKQSADKLLEIIGPHMKFRYDELSDAIETLMELRPAKGRKWTKEEIEYLKSEYPKQNIKQIAVWLGRLEGSVHGQLSRYHLWRSNKWQPHELEYLINNYQAPIKTIMQRLGRSHSAIVCKKVGLKKKGLI